MKMNCYRLLRLANNILDFVKLESGYLKLNLTDCNIVFLVEEIRIELYHMHIKRK